MCCVIRDIILQIQISNHSWPANQETKIKTEEIKKNHNNNIQTQTNKEAIDHRSARLQAFPRKNFEAPHVEVKFLIL